MPRMPQDGASIPQEGVLTLEEAWQEPASRQTRRLGWAPPFLAILAILGWTGFFLYAQRDVFLAGASPRQWAEGIAGWAVPVLLVVSIWLLAMRTSRREAGRFADAARLLADEAACLENRLTTVNRELSLARDFIAAQSRDLEALGRIASERLSQNADRLAALILDNGRQIEAIATVSTAALENMERLRGDLPVIANSARDAASQIGNAGHTAHARLEELISGFHRLNEFGQASERQVESFRDRVDAAIAAFEAQAARLGEITAERFRALEEQGERLRSDLDQREIEALAAIRRRAETLAAELAAKWEHFDAREAAALETLGARLDTLRRESDAFDIALREGEADAIDKWREAIEGMRKRLSEALVEIAEIDAQTLDQTRKRLSALGKEAREVDQAMQMRVERFMTSLEERRAGHRAFEAEALAALEQRLAELDAAIAERQRGHLAHVETLTQRTQELAARLADLGQRIGEIASQGDEASQGLAEGLAKLSGAIADNHQRLRETDAEIAGLTDASVRLLELIRASSEHSRSQLPQALEAARQSLSEFEERTRSAGLILEEASRKGRELSDHVLASREGGKAVLEELDQLHRRLAEEETARTGGIEQMRASLAELAQASEALAARSRDELSAAIGQLQSALRATIEQLDRESGEAIERIAQEVGTRSAEAFDLALRMRTREAAEELERAAVHASGVSREAASQLHDQLARVDELAANLENRIQRAREQAEEQVDNDFARRVALITESLNSHAIDIAKALSNDVTDTAWAAYLRGDRGIFTRRAVRLLDNSQARAIAEIYDRDHDFREHVSRYIHDFETMLRTLLSTRDGNALAVTLLSSDMGKLYVALAQAIERLRG